jgi:hypothetical protein
MIKRISLWVLLCVFSQVVSAAIIYSPSESNGNVSELTSGEYRISTGSYTGHICTTTSYISEGGSEYSKSWLVMEFPIDSFNNMDIQNASLNFYCYDSLSNLPEIYSFDLKALTGQSGDGVVSTDDIGNQNIFSSGTFPPYDDTWFSIDISNILQDAVNQSHNWMMFSIEAEHNTLGYGEMNFFPGKFALSENTTGKAPYLDVVAIPEPATMGLFIAGLLSMTCKRRMASAKKN